MNGLSCCFQLPMSCGLVLFFRTVSPVLLDELSKNKTRHFCASRVRLKMENSIPWIGIYVEMSSKHPFFQPLLEHVLKGALAKVSNHGLWFSNVLKNFSTIVRCFLYSGPLLFKFRAKFIAHYHTLKIIQCASQKWKIN